MTTSTKLQVEQLRLIYKTLSLPNMALHKYLKEK